MEYNLSNEPFDLSKYSKPTPSFEEYSCKLKRLFLEKYKMLTDSVKPNSEWNQPGFSDLFGTFEENSIALDKLILDLISSVMNEDWFNDHILDISIELSQLNSEPSENASLSADDFE
jgi:hypothetical protein